MSNQYGAIQYDDSWIRENYKGKCDAAFVDAYNNHTGKSLKKDTLRHHLSKLDILSSYQYTDEQKGFIRQNYEKYGMRITADMFNAKFNTDKSPELMCRVAKRMGLSVPKDVANKNANPDIDEVGTIREEPSTGYLVIKTGNSYKDWMKYQRYVYEQAYGKIPKDHVVVFLDGNNRNFELSNLMAVPKNYVVYMNTFDMRTDCPELTKVAIRWCELYEVLKEKGVI